MNRWIRVSTGPVFWITAVQVMWTGTLALWISYFIRSGGPEDLRGWGTLVAGIVLLVFMLGGVVIIVVHFARQVAHTRAVKDFISQVSHDLRSPLATVKLHLETMQMRELSPEQNKECLCLALAELQRLESGIEGVLTASRVERSGLRLDSHREDVGALLEEYINSKRDEVTLKGGCLAAGQLPEMWAMVDRALIRQMLDNLVDNAILHCKKGVNIRIGLAEQGGCAVISVLDDGPGLDRQEWKKVFRMFYRAPKTASRSGTGLGLFIVAGIANAHGGRTWVDSEGPSRGCNFRVALPLNVQGKEAA